MTQTVRTACGRNAVWIEADHGQGRRSGNRKVEWYKITLVDYLERVNLEELDDHQASRIREQLQAFRRGYAYEACDDDGRRVEYFATFREARDWAWSQDC